MLFAPVVLAVATVIMQDAPSAQASSAPTAAPAGSAAPASSAAPLPVIGRTHSKTFCTVVRDNIAPAVLGLMKSDELIDSSQQTYARFGGAGIDGPHSDLERVSLGKAVTGIAHNQAILQALLDAKHFPTTVRSDDDRLAVRLRAQLQEALTKQNDALNIINGILETDLLRKSLGGRHGKIMPTSRAFFRDVAVAIGVQRTAIQQAETQLTPTVVEAAKACGGTQ